MLIGHIAPLPILEAEANEEELRSVEGISSHSRRAERLAWRILLRKAAERGTGVLAGAEQTAEKGAEKHTYKNYISFHQATLP